MNVVTGSYFLLCALCLTLLVAPRAAWWVKLPVIILTPLLTFAVWHAASSFTGWPTDQAPAARSVFVWGVVHEPDPLTGDKGEILLWLIPIDYKGPALGFRPDGTEPRSYRLPYSRQLHGQVAAALQYAKNGQQAELDRAGKPGAKGKGAAGTGQKVPRWAFRAYRLPPPRPPSKQGG